MVLEEVLGLNGRSSTFSDSTVLLGSLPELDSMAVVHIIGAFEERFNFIVDDDEIDGDTFQTVGSLVEFVTAKMGGSAPEVVSGACGAVEFKNK